MSNHLRLCCRLVLSQHFSHLLQKRCNALACGLDQKFVPVLAHVPSKEVEPMGDVRDQCLFRGQLQATSGEKLLDSRFDLFFPTVPERHRSR